MRSGQLFVKRQAHVDIATVIVGQQGWGVQVDVGCGGHGGQQVGLFARLERGHGLAEHVVVHLKANFHDVAALLVAQHLACAPNLEVVHRLRVLCEPYGVVKVDATPGVTLITFRANASVDPAAILGMIQRNRHIKLAGNDKLRIEKPLEDPLARAQLVRDTLRQLGQPVAQES